MMTTLAHDADVAERSLTITRTVNAPRALVFQAWTDPRHVDQWWGPDGFVNITSEMEVRVGGLWRYIMHAPDGTDYPNRVVYTDVVAPERLGYWQSWDQDDDPDKFHGTVEFVEQNATTLVKMMSVFPTIERLAFVKSVYGAEEGGIQTLARMDEYVTTLQ